MSAGITNQEAISWAGITTNLTAMDYVVPAVNAYVNSLPQIDREPDGSWSETTKLAALMLTNRLYKRQNSASGIVTAGDSSQFVSRYDSDIARLLHIDGFHGPVVA